LHQEERIARRIAPLSDADLLSEIRILKEEKRRLREQRRTESKIRKRLNRIYGGPDIIFAVKFLYFRKNQHQLKFVGCTASF
jgi:hypothetical protein